MKTLKITLLAVLLFFITHSLTAQTKYEYAVLSFKPVSEELILSQNGTEFKKIEVSSTDRHLLI